MPQRSSWLAVQMLINQHLTDLASLAEFFLTLFFNAAVEKIWLKL